MPTLHRPTLFTATRLLGLSVTLAAAPLLAGVDPSTARQDAATPDQAPLPSGAAATIDGQVEITIDEYKDHLLKLYGKGPLEEMVYQRLLDRELVTLGLAFDAEAARARMEADWQRFVDARHQGSLESVALELAQRGFTIEAYKAILLLEEQRQSKEAQIVFETRTVSDEQIAERFEQLYGVDGIRVEVRHLFLNRARYGSELRRAGAGPDEMAPEAIAAAMRARVEDYMRQLAAGADFETLARTHSHDLSVQQNGGLIPNYNYRRYGEPFAVAVRAAATGAAVGPVESPAGLHILRVESRTQTALEEVRDVVTESLMAADPTFTERNELRQRLFAAAEIQLF
ncbi:MAG: peptidylprolyl isomerase [Planctomycetota bacterium]